ncbi:hypothetical protein KFE98_02150 [bacterium SCSIO 12741]|nr:hypothetical protein KFE98_02150 [bacterium SCSIO 12741]
MGGPGAGMIFHMITTLKNNRALLKKKRAFKNNVLYLKHEREGIRSIPISDKQLQKIQAELLEEQKERARKRWLLLALSACLTAGLFYLISEYLMDFWNWGQPM